MPPDALAVLVIGLTMASGMIALASMPPGSAVVITVGVMVFAPLYVGVPLGAMGWVRAAHGPPALFWLIALIMVSDSAQYYVGTLLGRRKLAPVVSPGKTVEGAIGGLVIGPIAGIAIGWWALPALSMQTVGALSVVLVVFGIMGDLFESLLKRSVGAKDSSALIPGHGGVLDRIDAYLFAAPVYYMFLRYVA